MSRKFDMKFVSKSVQGKEQQHCLMNVQRAKRYFAESMAQLLQFKKFKVKGSVSVKRDASLLCGKEILMLKKPMTTEEYFHKVCGILKEKGMLPDILDYGLATHDPIPMKTYAFSIRNNVDYGSSEGIYLALWIEYYENQEKRMNDIGTFKTLAQSNEAMHIIAKLLADFIIEGCAYVNANLDDFTWEGADVHPIDENGKRISWGYSCSNMEAALKEKDELLKKYPQVVVRNNETRKEKTFNR